MPARWLIAFAATLLAGASCRRAPGEDTPATSARPSATATAEPRELEAAARGIVAFLRGEAPLAGVALADSVALYVSPEGGGGRTVIARPALARPEGWVARSAGRSYTLVPPPGLTKLTTRVGRHLDCREHPLSSRFPELARLPHVGTMLQSADAGSCLRTWNVTFVFDSAARPPRLVAAVYDQWEW